VTRIRKLGALALASPLAMGFTILGAPLPAHAATTQVLSPANGAVITSGSAVTVKGHFDIGITIQLVVTTPSGARSVVASKGGFNSDLSGSVNIARNGKYTAQIIGKETSHTYDTNTFTVRVPPAAPSGLSATVSGKKLTVRWSLGSEADLTGYKVTAGGQSHSVGRSSSTSFTLSSNTTGSVNVGVQARRSNGSGGTVVSGISHTSATVGSGGGSGGGTPNIPNYTNPSGNNTPLTPVNPNSGLNLPTVAPNGSNPGFVYPTPTPEVATQNQVTPKAKSVADVSQMAWGRSLALALILLVCAAHLGTWTRRLRFAQAGLGAGGRLGRKGGGKARVKTAHERIAQAEALAKTGTLTKADILGKSTAATTQSPEVAGTGKAAAKQTKVGGRRRSKVRSTAGQATESGDLPVAKGQVEEAMAALTGLATKSDLSTASVAAIPTVAESASRPATNPAPIQPLDRPAAATASPLIVPLGEITEWDGEDGFEVEMPGAEDGFEAEMPGTKVERRQTTSRRARRGRRHAK
jgi:hypothetical protein